MITHIGGYKIPDNATHLSVGSFYHNIESVSFYRKDSDDVVWWKINNDPWVSLGKTKDLEGSRIVELKREEKVMNDYIPHGATHFAQALHESKSYYIVKGNNADYWHWRDREWRDSYKSPRQLTPIPKPGFTKSDLRTGMIVTFKNGDKATVLLNYETISKQVLNILRTNTNGWMNLDDGYEDNLEYSASGDRYGYSIVKVEQPTCGAHGNFEVVYPAPKEETQEEKDYKEALIKLEDLEKQTASAKRLVEFLNPNKEND